MISIVPRREKPCGGRKAMPGVSLPWLLQLSSAGCLPGLKVSAPHNMDRFSLTLLPTGSRSTKSSTPWVLDTCIFRNNAFVDKFTSDHPFQMCHLLPVGTLIEGCYQQEGAGAVGERCPCQKRCTRQRGRDTLGFSLSPILQSPVVSTIG